MILLINLCLMNQPKYYMESHQLIKLKIKMNFNLIKIKSYLNRKIKWKITKEYCFNHFLKMKSIKYIKTTQKIKKIKF